mmetsp:Transcript_35719/g.43039  ORF Transcript_35719/g.43039 Transcript_35719/m.43039 type:complete len:172 (-) Transcript_35719:147-662(-)|eukprot:CAMPEP_0194355684 /NCGR_PEP_ID=MMETSP0174-20130528/3558_1 /TAXON_ID=216777 /ORGANISM="Proboscia alata, Strain PI-D3" /LENGTH=171 /DNA_ID=CAMNT_0039125049 /DNA_START=41 /DNA_END=556 /DNA_ORIENTATION=+
MRSTTLLESECQEAVALLQSCNKDPSHSTSEIGTKLGDSGRRIVQHLQSAVEDKTKISLQQMDDSTDHDNNTSEQDKAAYMEIALSAFGEEIDSIRNNILNVQQGKHGESADGASSAGVEDLVQCLESGYHMLNAVERSLINDSSLISRQSNSDNITPHQRRIIVSGFNIS